MKLKGIRDQTGRSPSHQNERDIIRFVENTTRNGERIVQSCGGEEGCKSGTKALKSNGKEPPATRTRRGLKPVGRSLDTLPSLEKPAAITSGGTAQKHDPISYYWDHDVRSKDVHGPAEKVWLEYEHA